MPGVIFWFKSPAWCTGMAKAFARSNMQKAL
jgi:hypothetical protein